MSFVRLIKELPETDILQCLGCYQGTPRPDLVALANSLCATLSALLCLRLAMDLLNNKALVKNLLLLVNRVVLVLLARGVLDALPIFNSVEPLSPSRPRRLMLTTFAHCWHPQPALLVFVEDPKSHGPWRHHKVNQLGLFSKKVRTLSIHFVCELPQFLEKLFAELLDWLSGLSWLELQESVERGNHARGDVIAPDSGDGPLVGV